MTLEPQELVQLTRRVKPSAQCRVLDALGIVYRKREDGSPAVLRATVEATLGAQPTVVAARPQVKLVR